MSALGSFDRDFFKKWSQEMSYVLGYFAADGSMICNTHGGKYVEFTTTDRHLLVLLKRVSGASQKISARPSRNVNWKKQYRIQIGSKVWFDDLTSLGFTVSKSSTLIFPDVPNHFTGDFVRGYFDGDGCVYFAELKFADRKAKRRVLLTLFTSGSRSFLESLWSELKKRGVLGGSIQSKNRGFELKLSTRDSLALYGLMYNTASVLDIYLPRKRQKLERAVQAFKLRE